MRCCIGDGGAGRGPVDLRGRPAGGGRKPPQGASVKSRGAERCGEGAPRARQVWAEKANASEPLMTCRKLLDDIETGVEAVPRDEPGGSLLTGQAVSGMKVARARLWLRCGTWESVAPMARPATWRSIGPRPAEARTPSGRTARGRVVMRGTGADRLVVAVKPGNAGGATEAGRPGSLAGQPSSGGRSR
jgi:hypothetical protein